MALPVTIGASVFSDIAVAVPATPLTVAAMAALASAADFQGLFVTEINSAGGTPAVGTFARVKNLRELPPVGTPPNLVNVPEYGAQTSKQIQGQSDVTPLDIVLNYVPADWAAGTVLGDMVGDGNQYVIRFALLDSKPLGYDSNVTPALGIGSIPNTQFYWVGKIEALVVNPQLTDASQATVTLSVQSDFFGAFTE